MGVEGGRGGHGGLLMACEARRRDPVGLQAVEEGGCVRDLARCGGT